MFLLQMKLGVDPWRCGYARAHGFCWNPTIFLGGYDMDINSFVGLTVFKCFIRTSSLPNEFQDNIIISPIPAMYFHV